MSFCLSINRLKEAGTFDDVTEQLGYNFNYVGSPEFVSLIDKFQIDTNLGPFLPEDCQAYFRPKSEDFKALMGAALQNPNVQTIHLKMLCDVELDDTLWFLFT